MKGWLAIGLSVVCASCAQFGEQPVAREDHPSGWGKGIREVAVKTYLYAQMASNSYHDSEQEKDVFRLPSNVALIRHSPNDEIGFSYSVYVINDNGKPVRVVIAYRGTDEIKDWWYGNLLASQNKAGLALYDEIRQQFPAEVPISVTGHSLGGGIATEVSLCRTHVNSMVFNTSPRFSAGPQPAENDRDSVVEYGEILKVLRIFGREATQRYTSIGCSSGLPLAQHAQHQLAVCLTQIAAWETVDARQSLLRNELPDPVTPTMSRAATQ